MRRLLITLIAALAVTFLQDIFVSSQVGDELELKLTDTWFQYRGETHPPKEVVILAMDEASYSLLGLPMDEAWPRAVHAEMLQRLADLGAKRAVMDILFLGPSANPRADQALSEAIARMPTVIGAEYASEEHGSGAAFHEVGQLLLPYEPLAREAEQIALTKMPDSSGVMRTLVLPRNVMTETLPVLYEAALGSAAKGLARPEARDLIWYYGPAGTIPTYSYHIIMRDEYRRNAELFRNKIVFIGLNLMTGVGPMQKDSFITPFGGRATFGVEIQATAAANLLEQRWVRRYAPATERLLIACLCLFLVLLMTAVRPHWGFLLLVSAALGWLMLSYQSFLGGRFLPGVTLFGITLPLTFLGSNLIYYVATYRAHRKVERAFKMYLPPAMARAMRSDPRALQLGGEEVMATALFTDIAGFTTIAQGMKASEVGAMLNAYFDNLTRVIFAHQGTLLKFIGDAVFVIWGAPLKVPNHAELACRAAQAIQEAVILFNALKKYPPLDTRIGLHTGLMLVGNLGSSSRFDYTAIGDCVNLASRLEGVGKYFGVSVIISGETKKSLPAEFSAVELGRVVVAGRTAAEPIYTLFDKPLSQEVRTRWAKALSAYAEQRWDEARVGCEFVARTEPCLKKAALFYLSFIHQYASKPPRPGWVGEIPLSGK